MMRIDISLNLFELELVEYMNPEEAKIINNWIEDQRPTKWQLLYKASRHGWSSRSEGLSKH
jgi:hypothetical protein